MQRCDSDEGCGGVRAVMKLLMPCDGMIWTSIL